MSFEAGCMLSKRLAFGGETKLICTKFPCDRVHSNNFWVPYYELSRDRIFPK